MIESGWLSSILLRGGGASWRTFAAWGWQRGRRLRRRRLLNIHTHRTVGTGNSKRLSSRDIHRATFGGCPAVGSTLRRLLLSCASGRLIPTGLSLAGLLRDIPKGPPRDIAAGDASRYSLLGLSLRFL